MDSDYLTFYVILLSFPQWMVIICCHAPIQGSMFLSLCSTFILLCNSSMPKLGRHYLTSWN